MNEELEELATQYVLDQMNAFERAAFETRLIREPRLAALVQELQTTFERGVHALPRHAPPGGTLRNIEARIDELHPRKGAAESGAGAPAWFGFARWGIAAVIAVSLATIAIQTVRHPSGQPTVVVVGLDANRNTFADLPVQNSVTTADQRFMHIASLAENFWKKPSDLPVKGRSAPDGSRAFAVFDPKNALGFIAIENLPVAPENQRYHLWIVDQPSGRTFDAGVLPLEGARHGLYSFALAPGDAPSSDHPNFLITLEDEDAPQQSEKPRGKVVLGRNNI